MQAAEAGLQENDIITTINGNEISGSKALVDAVGNASVRDELTLTVCQQTEPQNRQERQMILPWGNRFRR